MPQPNELLCLVNDTLPPKTYTNTTVLTYPIPFPFVNQNDVVVISRNGNVDTILDNQAFDASGTYTIDQGVNPSLVTFTSAPGADQLIITRMTDICKMLVVYEAGASIRAEDLNAGNTQLLHLIQENYGLIKEIEARIGKLLTTPLYQTNPPQDESSWTNERIPSGAAALAQLNASTSVAPLDAGDYYDGKLWFQPSNTTQATGVTIEYLPGSSSGLNPVWPGGSDLDAIPNTVQTYAFDQNVSDNGTNLQISVSIENSNINLVTIVNGGESWEINDTAETGDIAVSNGAGNIGTIRLRATVTNVAPGLSFFKIRDQGQWKTISANDPSTNPFIPAQTLYVNTQGNDSNSGLTPSTAFRTIKKAVYECNKFRGVPETLTFETSGGDEPVYNNTTSAVNGIPPGYIRYICTGPTGLESGDIVTIPQSIWSCNSGNENYPTAGPTKFAVTVFAGEPNNLYIDVGPTPTAHTFVSTVSGDPGFNNQIPVRQSRVGDNFQIQVAPGSYDEMMPIVIYAKNLCITGSSLRNTYVHPRIVNGTQPDGTDYIPAPLGDVTDDKGNVIKIWDTEVRTMFYCDSGTYVNNMTVCGIKSFFTRDADGNVIRGGAGSIDPNPVYGLPAQQGWIAALRPSDNTLGSLVDGSVPTTYTKNQPGCFISKSPYIQNCTNFSDINIDNGPAFNPQFLTGEGGDTASAPTGGGILCDGNSPSPGSPLRSFVVDAFTQIALNGPGILATNKGYAQLVSFFGTFCWYHAKSLNGGQLNLSNCTTDFGQYGLIADQGTMGTGGSDTNQPVFTGQIESFSPAADVPTNVEVATVSDALWNNTSTTQNSIPPGQIRFTVDLDNTPVVGQTLKLSNLTFAEWDPNAPTNPSQGDPDPTGTGAYVGTRIKVPGFSEGNTFVISTVTPIIGTTYHIFVNYKQENLSLGSTNTYDSGAYTNTTSGGQTVYAGFIQDQNTGVATVQLPTSGTGAGVPSTFIRVNGFGNVSPLWQQPRKPEPGPTQLIEIVHSEGSVFYPILTANRVDADSFDLEIYSPYSTFDRRNLGLIYDADPADLCRFYLQSYISTGGHTFEFVGSGTDYDAHPDLGGEGNPANQAVELGGVVNSGSSAKDLQINNLTKFNQGRVWLSSTDENGTFQVGDTFIVNQKTGLISIDPSVITAPKVEITEDLDMNQWGIVTTFGTDTNLLLQPKGTGGIVISNSDTARPAQGPSNAPIIGPLKERTSNNPFPATVRNWDVVTQQDIGYDPNEVPIGSLLGQLAYTNTPPSVGVAGTDPKPNEVKFYLSGTDLIIKVGQPNGTVLSSAAIPLS